ncbi:MAG: EAL domain-containing protein, partial [Gammaproteobacteria bacterium]
MTKKLTLLIIDDDPDTRKLIEHSLSNEVFDFLHAGSGELALEIIEQTPPDLIMLDVIMPGIDGFNTCVQIRDHEKGTPVPILIMSSLDDMDSINNAYNAGATDFVIKPFNPTLLQYQIKFLLKSKRIHEELKSTQQRLDTTQRIANLGHWEWSFNDNIVTWSDEVCQIMGFTASTKSASHYEMANKIHVDDAARVKDLIKSVIQQKTGYQVEHRITLPNHQIKTVLQEAKILLDRKGNVEKVVGTLQDITDQKMSEDKIKTLSYYDKLTGLPNRKLLKRLLKKYIQKAHPKQAIPVLTITLDRYKLITDSYGHAFGESLIRKIAIRLIRSVKDSVYYARNDYENIFQKPNLKKHLTIAHCGGDEFVVLLPEISEVDDTALIAKNITDSLSKPYLIDGQEVRATASIGISVHPVDGKDSDALLKSSATALYHAKRQGGDGYKFYTAKMNTRAFERLTLETQLRRAIDENQFILFYQPKMSLSTNKLVGMETLLRWEHPELGLISPDDFINVIEKTGLVISLGERIIKAACDQIKQWESQGYQLAPVAINLSPVQLRQKDLHLRIGRILKKTKVKAQMIEFEITENSLMNNIDRTISMLKKLRLLGTQISLDDFGTGYSSLTYLKHFPVNSLKIDRSFVENVTSDQDDAAIIKGVTAMAHNMQLEVIAEGIEDQEQLTFLKNIGCDYGQGYFYSEPVDAKTFTKKFMRKIDHDDVITLGETTNS